MRETSKRALEYVRNTGGNATIETFDDDHEPIGPLLREEIIPMFVEVDKNGKLVLTEAGKEKLK